MIGQHLGHSQVMAYGNPGGHFQTPDLGISQINEVGRLVS